MLAPEQSKPSPLRRFHAPSCSRGMSWGQDTIGR